MKRVSQKGRPTGFTQALANEICNAIASNSKGIKVLCHDNPHWPNKDTIFTWLKNNNDFSDQYARAKRCQIECIVDELLDIADDGSHDQMIDEEGHVYFNSQSIQRARLKIDTRKWLASKLVPKVYGANPEDDKLDLKMEREIREMRAKLDEKNRKEY
ncbi:hypothetical protein [Legionella feeleii]|uniref:Terminase small subunit n=1 Tax=Legionella feeleii TaxID=453 RepID=A0A0W0U4G7_9GAMM|nr:hypothetical protein [Legionella feeleii]KTD02655.1 hypothetical protein Lfee_0810 [Legionella feeleii]SPX61211.1 Uncharacterised protein [Legionella feeleii]